MTIFFFFFFFLPYSLPEPVPPRLDIMKMFIGDSFAIAMVAFAISLSMAKLLSKKHKYIVRPNQVSSIFLNFVFLNSRTDCSGLHLMYRYYFYSSSLILTNLHPELFHFLKNANFYCDI